MKKIIALIFLVTLIVFTACQSAEESQNEADKKADEKLTKKQTQEEYLKEQKEASNEYLEIEAEAIQKADAEICDKVKDQNRRYSCQFNVLAGLAAEKKDPSLCEDIENEGLVEDCKSGAIGEDN